MKDAEDEAFDELAKRQGMWGGGFQAKRAMAADRFKDGIQWWMDTKTYGAYPNPPQWHIDTGNLVRLVPAQPAQDGKCKLCIDGCAACDARAQPAQEPVAHLWECLGKWSAYLVTNGKQADCAPPSWLVEAIQNATAPPKREWVGLTDEDIDKTYQTMPRINKPQPTPFEFARAVEQLLKEKNNA